MTPEDLIKRLDAPLSPRRRIGYVALALTGLAGSGLIGLLWATEPGLPPRTVVAFAVMMAIGLCWAAFGGWAVTRRTPMFAHDRVVAGWLGVAAWLLFTVGALVITTLRHKLEPSLLVVVLALGVLAIAHLRAARRARAALLRRREELSRA
ncbi:hypothetical protein [Micromonospora narathiwatensis]|uniref:Transmembrane protein n=1 Tax=Micromonospora narathiwatensis TaxID=299146 RepID=A0A1A8ZZH3_9ACTN|nr:hypothetical protein [Micromonospora narathiwatensis]SBT49290.1 hypothetical protein GA0070621_3405 [Micromonospora narathiwatensis]